MKFVDVLTELSTLHKKKSADYAKPEDPYYNFRTNAVIWGQEPYLEPLKRATEKLIRISQLQGKEAQNEGIEDSLRDVAVLSIIALGMFKEEKGV